MKKIAFIVVLNLCFIVGTTGCSTLSSNLPTVISYAESGMIVLDTIKTFADKYFRNNVNTALETKVFDGISKAELALHAALTAAQGAKNLDQKQIDAAFSDFKMAYMDLMGLVGPLGVTATGSSLVKGTTGGLIVPLPLALVPHA